MVSIKDAQSIAANILHDSSAYWVLILSSLIFFSLAGLIEAQFWKSYLKATFKSGLMFSLKSNLVFSFFPAALVFLLFCISKISEPFDSYFQYIQIIGVLYIGIIPFYVWFIIKRLDDAYSKTKVWFIKLISWVVSLPFCFMSVKPLMDILR